MPYSSVGLTSYCTYENGRLEAHDAPLFEHAAAEGCTPDLQDRLSKVPRPARVAGVYLARMGDPDDRIIAAYAEKLVGQSPVPWDSHMDPVGAGLRYHAFFHSGPGPGPSGGAAIYMLVVVTRYPTWVEPLGLALLSGGLALAWVALAL